jgi:hypothetical protein
MSTQREPLTTRDHLLLMVEVAAWFFVSGFLLGVFIATRG